MKGNVAKVVLLLAAMAVVTNGAFAVVISEDFESYTPSTSVNWTGSVVYSGGWVPTYNAYGWAGQASNYIWPSGGYYSPQLLRRFDTGTGGGVIFWDQSADITALDIQTLSARHRGVVRNTNNYARIVIGNDRDSVEYESYNTTGKLGGIATNLPTNNVAWTPGTGLSSDWFETQIEYDYLNGLVRARFGQLSSGLWNDWTAWQAMSSTLQPVWCRFGMDGIAELDDVNFTATASVGGSGSWDVDASGSWHDSSNWTLLPADNTRTAVFGSEITAETVVYTETGVVIKGIVFDNSNQYVIAGFGGISMEADSGDAIIDVQTGSHQFQTEITLLSNTDVNVPGGTSLSLNGPLDLNGLDLNFNGSGTLAISGVLLTNGGNINNVDGGTLIVADKNGDGIADIQELAMLAAYWLN